MRGFFLLTLLSLSCTNGPSGGPAEVKYDRDTCATCGMAISDPAFTTEIRGPNANQTMKFDDLGCALRWLDQQPFKDDPATQLWVTGANGQWVDGRTARYASGKTTPMAYGYGPAASDGLGLDEVRAQLRQKKEAAK